MDRGWLPPYSLHEFVPPGHMTRQDSPNNRTGPAG